MATNGDLKRWYSDIPEDKKAKDFVRVGADGKIPSNLLPSYVDDVIEGYYHESEFYKTRSGSGTVEDPYIYTDKITGESGKIYVDLETSNTYRWSGTIYVRIGGSESGLTVQAGDTQQVDGFDCPDLTVEQVTTVYNALVAGSSVTIQSEDGDVQFRAQLGDAVTGRPSVLIPYYWLGWIDYQITEQDTVAITVHKVPEEPAHKITSVVVGADTIDLVIS